MRIVISFTLFLAKRILIIRLDVMLAAIQIDSKVKHILQNIWKDGGILPDYFTIIPSNITKQVDYFRTYGATRFFGSKY